MKRVEAALQSISKEGVLRLYGPELAGQSSANCHLRWAWTYGNFRRVPSASYERPPCRRIGQL